MNTKKTSLLLPALFFLLMILACQSYAPIATPTPTIDPVACVTQTEPTQADIDFTLDFGDKIFTGGDWKRAYTVESQRLSASWTSDDLSSVGYLDYLIFSCGTTADELEGYFNRDYWPVLFQNYEGYEPINSCGSLASTKLWEFDATSSGSDYQVLYWVRQESASRVLTMFFVYPPDSETIMQAYATQMFPDLTSCAP
ncbi:MAG TPA: hypothetical protein PK530_07960 [Anaerolineales bacterium]|nr:hypothetical protein [Anaerolineales bacterium]